MVYCDGGSRGNPGPAAAGVVIKTTEGDIVASLSKYYGVQTNNFAEYSAVILALDWLIDHKKTDADFYLDSQLVVRQLNGQYKVKQESMRQLFDQVKSRANQLNTTFTHVYREDNKEADAMVNQCLDSIIWTSG